MNPIKTQKKVIHFFIAVIFLLLVVVTFLYSSNIPYSDDFNQQLDSISQLQRGKKSLLNLMLRQHNEHRLFTTYIITYGYYFITGLVNHKVSILVSVFMLGGIWVTIKQFLTNEHNSIFALIIALMLFVPECVSTVWAGGSVQYYGVVLFGLLSITHLSKSPTLKSITLSIVFLFLSSYSMIAGVLVAPVGFLYILFSRKITNKYYIAWLIGALLILVSYFYNYRSPGHHPSVMYALSNPIFTFQFTFVLLGAFWTNQMNNYFLPFFTIGATAIFAYYGLIKITINNLLKDKVFYAFLYMLLVAGSIVAGRAGFLEIGNAFADRYFIYTKCLWLLSLILLVNYQHISKTVIYVILGGALVFSSDHYNGVLYCLDDHKSRLENSLINHLFEENSNGLEYPNLKFAAKVIDKAILDGYYKPDITTAKSMPIPISFDHNANVNYQIDKNKVINDYKYFRGWAYLEGKTSNKQSIKIGISSALKTTPSHIFQTTTTERPDVQQVHGSNQVDYTFSGFNCVINPNKYGYAGEELRYYLIIENRLLEITSMLPPSIR